MRSQTTGRRLKKVKYDLLRSRLGDPDYYAVARTGPKTNIGVSLGYALQHVLNKHSRVTLGSTTQFLSTLPPSPPPTVRKFHH